MNENKFAVKEEFERHVLLGLSFEWEKMRDKLSSWYSKKMKKPIFSLSDMVDTLGVWYLNTRTISLSRHFIYNHPWDAICYVLYHEMAHQLVDEVLGGKHEPPHGELFHQACTMLRILPNAKGDKTSLHHDITFHANKSENPLIVRIKKLMALAESTNQHEAELAMAKAHELLKKYNIEILEANQNKNFYSIYVGKPSLRHTRDIYSLSLLLTEFYFVDGVWISSFVIEKQKMGRVFEISGTAQNVQIASYVYDYIRQFINMSWSAYNKGKSLSHHRKSDYAYGIIEGFRSKLTQASTDSNNGKKSTDRSVITIADPNLIEYIKFKYPRISRSSFQSASDEIVYNDGVQVGKNLVIAKGVTQKGRQNGLYIGNNK